MRHQVIFIAVAGLLAFCGDLFGDTAVDRFLANEAPKLCQKLKHAGCRTVAVMPFRFRAPGTNESRLDGAIIQTNLAAKLERALAAYYDPEIPLHVVFDGWGQVLKKYPQADFNREDLFDIEFELPVGKNKVKVDAILTGEVLTNGDFTETRISFEYISRKNPNKAMAYLPRKGGKTTVLEVDSNLLVTMGRGFSIPRSEISTRGPLRLGENLVNLVSAEEAWGNELDQKNNVDDRVNRLELIDESRWNDSLIKITVLYSNQPQPLNFDVVGGRYNATIEDPDVGQKVTFQVENLTDQPLGLVLSVNGVNTLYGGDATDTETAAKWVLKPRTTHLIAGIYPNLSTRVTIEGKNKLESEELIKSGLLNPSYVGLIQATVYRQVANELVKNGVQSQGLSGKKLNSNLGNNSSQKSTHSIEKLNKFEKQLSGVTGQGGAQLNKGSAKKKQTVIQFNEERTSLDRNTNSLQVTKGHSGNSAKDNSQTFEFDYTPSEETGMNVTLIRGENLPKKGRGSFQPHISTSSAKSWQELAIQIGKRAAFPVGSRGLIAPGGEKSRVQLLKSSLKQIEVCQHINIRYYSVAK